MDNTLEVARMALLQAQEQQQRDAAEIARLRAKLLQATTWILKAVDYCGDYPDLTKIPDYPL